MQELLLTPLHFFAVDVFTQLIAFAVLTFPLFALPIVMKMAGGVMERFGVWANNKNRGVIDRSRKKGREMYERGDFARGKAIRKQADTEWRNKRFADRMAKGGYRRKMAEGTAGIKDSVLEKADKAGIFAKNSKIDSWMLNTARGSSHSQRGAIDRASRGVVASATSKEVEEEMLRLQDQQFVRSPGDFSQWLRTNADAQNPISQRAGAEMLSTNYGGAGLTEVEKLLKNQQFMGGAGAEGFVNGVRKHSSTYANAFPDVGYNLNDPSFVSKTRDGNFKEVAEFNWNDSIAGDAGKILKLKGTTAKKNKDGSILEVSNQIQSIESSPRFTVQVAQIARESADFASAPPPIQDMIQRKLSNPTNPTTSAPAAGSGPDDGTIISWR